jgi:hypothetical protein
MGTRGRNRTRYREKYFLDEHSDKIALMRRNDGDATPQYSKHDGKAFSCGRAAMQIADLSTCRMEARGNFENRDLR